MGERCTRRFTVRSRRLSEFSGDRLFESPWDKPYLPKNFFTQEFVDPFDIALLEEGELLSDR